MELQKIENGEATKLPLWKHNDIYVTIEEARETIYTNQNGAFPVQSRKGSRYIMILCEIDNNIIMSEPMKNRTTGEIIKAYKQLVKRLKSAGIKPKKQVLDNDISQEYKKQSRSSR